MARQIAQAVPRKLGFRMPAEWEPHAATWLAWPHESSDWPGKFAPIPWLYGEIVRLLARVERVRILVEHADAEHSIRRILKKCPVLRSLLSHTGNLNPRLLQLSRCCRQSRCGFN